MESSEPEDAEGATATWRKCDMFGLGATELVILMALVVMSAFVIGPIVLLVAALNPPKTPNKGSIIAVFIGPLAYIYVGNWAKAVGLFILGWITAGIIHLIIWPYSIFNIRRDVRRFNEDEALRQQQLENVTASTAG